jgi:hypothetical protein
MAVVFRCLPIGCTHNHGISGTPGYFSVKTEAPGFTGLSQAGKIFCKTKFIATVCGENIRTCSRLTVGFPSGDGEIPAGMACGCPVRNVAINNY